MPGAVHQQCGFQKPAARERGQAPRCVLAIPGQSIHHGVAIEQGAVPITQGLQFGVVAQVQKEQHALVEIQAGRVSFEAAANRQGALAEGARLGVIGCGVSERGARCLQWGRPGRVGPTRNWRALFLPGRLGPLAATHPGKTPAK